MLDGPFHRHAYRHGIPVFHIQHVAPAGSPVFADGSAGIEFHPDLDTDAREQSALPHAMLHRAALASIDDTFGDIMTTKQVMALPLG